MFMQWYVHVCICVHIFIAFKLPSHFYIVFTLISLFSLSERPERTVGKFLKKPVSPNSIKMMVSHCITIFCL